MKRLLIAFLILTTLQACSKPKHLEIGTGSQIDVLNQRLLFSKNSIPDGWVIEGMDKEDVFDNKGKLPNLYMTQKDGRTGVHLQNAGEDFILARYTRARLLVSPFLFWEWHFSEHRQEDHPISLIIGFYGGHPDSEPLSREALTWKGSGLPPFDRVLSIGFNDMALRRGNLFSKGHMKYYVQRGGIEQTNRWHHEAADLSLTYKRAWPQDDQGKVLITFVGMMAKAAPQSAGMTFSSIRLSR